MQGQLNDEWMKSGNHRGWFPGISQKKKGTTSEEMAPFFD